MPAAGIGYKQSYIVLATIAVDFDGAMGKRGYSPCCDLDQSQAVQRTCTSDVDKFSMIGLMPWSMIVSTVHECGRVEERTK